MAALLELSHELLHCILTETEPVDLAALAASCRTLHVYIRGNKLLHKDLYIRRYDLPRDGIQLAWESELHDLVKLEKILECSDRDVKDAALGFVAERITSLLATACVPPDDSRNIRRLSDCFADTANADAFLTASSLFARAGGQAQRPAPTPELQQASAKLHCLYGVPIHEIPSRSSLPLRQPDVSLSPAACTRLQARPHLTHTFARSKVYDLREYTEHSLWGPFMDDGSHRVDWEKVEAVMIVLGFNLRKYSKRTGGRFPMIWKQPFAGATPSLCMGPPPRDPDPCDCAEDREDYSDSQQIRDLTPKLDALDPYGVTGTWMRVVCFLDYHELYNFNFSVPVPDDQLRGPVDTEEGAINVEHRWRVTKIEPPDSRRGDDDEEEDDLDWSNFKGERLPVVHFSGLSRSLHASWDPDANSKIRGTVRQTPEGEIRWTTFSIFHGEERWRSESVQVGGLRSARVVGNWFDKDYDEHGPAGPTAFWKESDELMEEETVGPNLPYF